MIDDVELTGAEEIVAERKRQTEVECYTPEHDDCHVNGELASAAIAYVMHTDPHGAGENAVDVWPWADGFKPSDGDPIRDLKRAGAFIAAEIDRLKREKRRISNAQVVVPTTAPIPPRPQAANLAPRGGVS